MVSTVSTAPGSRSVLAAAHFQQSCRDVYKRQLLDGEAVELGRGQGAVADPVTYQTAQPDVFVGGDVYTGPRFAIDAIAAGKQGAVSIHRFVQPNTSMTIGRSGRSQGRPQRPGQMCIRDRV